MRWCWLLCLLSFLLPFVAALRTLNGKSDFMGNGKTGLLIGNACALHSLQLGRVDSTISGRYCSRASFATCTTSPRSTYVIDSTVLSFAALAHDWRRVGALQLSSQQTACDLVATCLCWRSRSLYSIINNRAKDFLSLHPHLLLKTIGKMILRSRQLAHKVSRFRHRSYTLLTLLSYCSQTVA